MFSDKNPAQLCPLTFYKMRLPVIFLIDYLKPRCQTDNLAYQTADKLTKGLCEAFPLDIDPVYKWFGARIVHVLSKSKQAPSANLAVVRLQPMTLDRLSDRHCASGRRRPDYSYFKLAGLWSFIQFTSCILMFLLRNSCKRGNNCLSIYWYRLTARPFSSISDFKCKNFSLCHR